MTSRLGSKHETKLISKSGQCCRVNKSRHAVKHDGGL